MPYAFTRTISDVCALLNVFIISSDCEMGISWTWCQSGEFVLECDKIGCSRIGNILYYLKSVDPINNIYISWPGCSNSSKTEHTL